MATKAETDMAAKLYMTVEQFRARYQPWRTSTHEAVAAAQEDVKKLGQAEFRHAMAKRTLSKHITHKPSVPKTSSRSKARYKGFSPTKREALYLRDEGRCRYCNVELDYTTFTIDHVVPWSRGGTHEYDNLVVACPSCNSRKQDRTPEEANMILIPLARHSV